jgi:radical SAM protein with 4Fe4S-binding SPASM domain
VAGLLGEGGVLSMGRNALSAPLSVLLELTYACNLRCKHCMSDDFGAAYAANEKSLLRILDREQSTAEIKATLDQLADAGVFTLFVSGGEPMVHPDFFEIVEHAYERGLFICLLTAATLIDEDNVERVKGCVNKVEANLDGASAKVYDYFRGVKGAYEWTVRGIKALVAHEVPMRLNVTLTRLTYAELPAILDQAYSLGVREVVAVPLRPSGRALLFKEKLDYGPEEYFEWVQELRKLKASMPSDMMFAFEYDYSVQALADPYKVMPSSGAGRIHCTITPTGKVKLQPETPNTPEWLAGDLRQDSFVDIWRNAPLFRSVRDPETPTFKKCPLRMCMGGCLVRATAEHGGLLEGTDPYCPYCSEHVGPEWFEAAAKYARP